jgi:hypothetical protein
VGAEAGGGPEGVGSGAVGPAAAILILGFAALMGGGDPDVSCSLPLPISMSREGSISISMGGGSRALGVDPACPASNAARQGRAIWTNNDNPAGFV